MKKLLFSFLSVLLLIFPLSAGAAPVDDIKKLVSQYYVGNLSGSLEQAQTIDEVIDLLDGFSDYFTAEEMKQFQNSVNMTTIGIGIVIEAHEKGIYINQVIEGGSAFEANIQAGDIITHVNDESLRGIAATEATTKITGAENTKVKLTLIQKDGQTVTKTLLRKPFAIQNAYSSMLYNQVGYIALSSFSSDAVKLVRNEIKKLTEAGATSFIFDLQNNTGGYVSSAEQIVGLFPNARNAYQYKTTEGSYLVRAQRQSVQFPAGTKVLINGMSASASEMTAAALKDQQIATLYGQKSYGKGSMQDFFPLGDGSYLKLTMAEFFGPAHTEINHIGIDPDVETAQPLAMAHLDTLKESFASYNVHSALNNVSPQKTFTVSFSTDVTHLQDNSIELVRLGGQKVNITVTTDKNKLLVTPTEPLISGASYLLLIHPKIKGVKASLKKGTYLTVTVK